MYLHYERPILGHVLSTIYMNTGIERRKRTVGDLAKDDISNHKIHWSRSRFKSNSGEGARLFIEFAVRNKPFQIIYLTGQAPQGTNFTLVQTVIVGLITIDFS
jgi:hypothetical protein